MAEISTKEVKALRDKTGAGIMNCKKALIECNGNVEEAVDWLRKKGLASAAKKASRVAAEGLVGLSTSDNCGSIIEINAETDFVARNELFQKFVSQTVELSKNLKTGLEELKQAPFADGKTVNEAMMHLISITGENMTLRRVAHLCVEDGVVASYVHNKVAPNLGKIGVLVGLKSKGDKSKLMELGKNIAMHIAAANPLSISKEDLDPLLIERERNVLIERAKGTGKLEEFLSKMVEGRLRKFYEDVVLLEQLYVIDSKIRVKDLLNNTAKELETSVEISGFVKFVLGDGIEKQVVDFASEVAQQLK